MKIEYKDNKKVRLSEIERGKCFEYDDILHIKTGEIRDGRHDKKEMACVDLEGGFVCWFWDDDVTPVNAKVVVEE